MRLGVLDIGSNTGHLLAVDAHGGAAPLPAYSLKQPLRLAEHLDEAGNMAESGITALVDFARQAAEVAEDKGCAEVMGFATSAVRDSGNAEEVLARVRRESGIEVSVLSGEDEARLTFLAVRRWFGWSAGRLMVFDIGGGSLEIAGGTDESPEVAWSLPLGAARLARSYLHRTPLPDEAADLRRMIRSAIAEDAGRLLRSGLPDRAVASSKTFRSLARITGAAPSAEGPLVRRLLRKEALKEWIPRLLEMELEQIAQLPGVSASRAYQVVPGALVAEACMDIFDLDEMEICPWALREGVILDRLDHLAFLGPETTAEAAAVQTAGQRPAAEWSIRPDSASSVR